MPVIVLFAIVGEEFPRNSPPPLGALLPVIMLSTMSTTVEFTVMVAPLTVRLPPTVRSDEMFAVPVMASLLAPIAAPPKAKVDNVATADAAASDVVEKVTDPVPEKDTVGLFVALPRVIADSVVAKRATALTLRSANDVMLNSRVSPTARVDIPPELACRALLV